MNSTEQHKLAVSLAQSYAPAPKHEPFMGGIAGTVIASGVVAVFTGLAGLPTEAFGQATTIMAVLGFVGPWLYLTDQQKKHNLAVQNELGHITEREHTRVATEGSV
jgi:predicted CDP-diglyceride synthetase/phosphatidate cytidylyltransferase